MATIPVNTSGVTDYIQSGFLHLAAAGSDASDHSATGIHLRWGLQGNLGDKHLPKGLLSASGTYATSIAYNRNNDYVTLFRATYLVDAYRTIVDLTRDPNSKLEIGPTREWNYTGLVPVAVVPSNTNTVTLRFVDVVQYDYLVTVYTSSIDILKNYTGLLEAFVVGKLFFSLFINLDNDNPNNTSIFRSEGVAVPDTTNSSDKILSCRKTETNGSATQIVLRGENLESARFSYSELYPISLSFQCYYDYLIGVNTGSKNGNWTKVDDYSLSITNTITDKRLEDTTLYTIDETWPRYLGANPTTGDFTVSVANYLDKWIPDTEPGVKEAVMRYLDKSKTDVFALDSLESDTANDQAEYDISYLETIKLIALDFHFARMFGLGCIDNPGTSTYIYATTFKTTKDPADETQSLNTHNVFMCLPTSRTDYRMPVAPYLELITYGMPIDNATSTPAQLTDENGYALYDDIRFINLNKFTYPYDQPLGPFYQNGMDFFMADVTRPVLFGAKYKLGSENDWRTPEISADPDYQDGGNNDEVVPFPETNGPFFTHLETEEGIHEYAVYGVNLFSRVSNLSNTRATNETDFPVRNTLLPPSNFQVQLIQPETPPLLTTSSEQNKLGIISGTDRTLVRATFEWNEVHNIAYQQADKVDFYFCDHAPLTIRGVITSVTNAADNHVQVQLGSFTITSANPTETIQPTISSGNVARFIGSQLAAGQQLYEVDSVVTSGSSPVLLIRKNKQTQSQEYPIGSNQFITTESYVSPSSGDIVMLVENMSNTSNWSTHLAKQVNLISFTPLHTETITLADGSQKALNYGGVYRSGTITQILELLIPNDPTSAVPTGVYTITFSNYNLPTHSDGDVDWYKGSVRVSSDSTPSIIKKLEVWNIDSSTSNLILTVFDPAFGTDPIVAGINPSRSGVSINFHPGYRVYLYKDNQSGNNFTASAILPATGEGSKITYMSIRAMDTTFTPDLVSPLSVPVPLLAREIVIPVAPTALNGPQYATRPNVYGKSTYTFDAQLDTTDGRIPFGLMFFRASDRIVLGALYNPETLGDVLEFLAGLTGDDATNYEQRILDVINGDIDTNSGNFKTYGSGTYFLPDPDNAELTIPDPNSVSLNDPLITPFDGNTTLTDLASNGILQAAIAHIFQPLTEQPVVYRYLKSGTKTSSKKPLFRDGNGQMIPPVLPTDPNYDPDDYDPFPMAVTYTDSGNKFVRFTDYTIDGAAINIYFYYAIEFSNTNTFSGRSPILGAVRLVNTLAPDAPQIRKVSSLPGGVSSLKTAVLFDINSYLPADGIEEYRIYRALNNFDASNVRSMELVATIDAEDPLADNFSDVITPLYGEVLHYRIVAVRITKDENGSELRVPSQPSNIAITNVIDAINPKAPKLRSVNGTATSTQLQDVILKWQPTTYNATYNLQKQSSAGNWVDIFSIKSNDPMQYPPLDQNSQPDFANFPITEFLERQDLLGNPIYHRFRVQVTNSSGLLNLSQDELTLARGCQDLQELEALVSYEDSNHIINPFTSEDVNEGIQNPQFMQFDNLLVELPAGHNSFSTDIIVTDDLANSFTKTLTSSTSQVIFNHGDGGLELNNSNPNRKYTIEVKTTTDACSTPLTRSYILKYISSPCHDLSTLTSLVNMTDDTHTIPVLVDGYINDGVDYPVSLTFMDLSNPAIFGQIFDGMDITVTDGYNNTATKSILAANPGTSVTFNTSDGLVLNNSSTNRSYVIDVTLYTDLCATGVTTQNVITYTPGEQLVQLTNIVSFSDNNGSNFNPLSNQNILNTHHAGGSMTFNDIVSTNLPQGHIFDHMSISLDDGLAGTATKDISIFTSAVTFVHGEGGLVLDSSILDLSYTITIVLYTDIWTTGTTFVYLVNYVP